MKHTLIRSLAAGMLALAATVAGAAGFPDRPVKLIVPYPAGGGTDAVSRLVAQKLSERWGQAVVVENRPGADTQIGNGVVAAAKPDGYTLLVIATTFTISKSMTPNLPYDPVKDFVPIAPFSFAPYFLVVGVDQPVKNVADLVALAKKNPGKLNYSLASSGNYMASTLMNKAAGIDAVAVRYKGGAPSIQAVVTGEVMYTLETPGSIAGLASKLRLLAVTGDHRLPLHPDVPTFTEAGLRGADIGSWVGIAGPKGLPADIADSINAAVRAVVALPEVREKFASFNVEPMNQTVPQFNAFIASEFDRYEAVVKANKLEPF